MTFTSLNANGIPDRYYEGLKRDLWVEFKALKSMPRDGMAKGNYTKVQLAWMTNRWHRRMPDPDVIGIVGLPDKTAVMQFTPDEWLTGVSVNLRLPFGEVAEWITDWCGA